MTAEKAMEEARAVLAAACEKEGLGVAARMLLNGKDHCGISGKAALAAMLAYRDQVRREVVESVGKIIDREMGRADTSTEQGRLCSLAIEVAALSAAAPGEEG